MTAAARNASRTVRSRAVRHPLYNVTTRPPAVMPDARPVEAFPSDSTRGRSKGPMPGERRPANEVRTIALVGNGRSMLKENGEVIDGHDLVGRFNFFRILGFEKAVGNRTDLWFLNQVSADCQI